MSELEDMDVFERVKYFRDNPRPEQHCVSCDEDGHTYLACKRVDFFGLVNKEMYRAPIEQPRKES